MFPLLLAAVYCKDFAFGEPPEGWLPASLETTTEFAFYDLAGRAS
jgi:hypothetical protein